MKTHFASLVKIKKDAMEKCERDLQKTNEVLQNAQAALKNAYHELRSASTPESGIMSQFLQSRTIITLQREIILQKQAWCDFARSQKETAKETLKKAVDEHEKFKYLEAEQIKALLLKQKQREQREMDEVAIQGFTARKRGEQ